MLSLRHLTIFKAAADTGSFTKAAEKLYITQSAVSHAIRELEEQNGCSLFDRASRQVCLTSQGRLLLDEITPLLASCASLEKRLGNLKSQAPIQIVSSITIASFWLPAIIQKAQKKIPGVPLPVKVVKAADAVKTLRSGNADIAFIEGPLPQGPFHYRRFADYPLLIVCAPDYPLFSHRIRLTTLCTEKLLLREPGSAIRDAFDSRLLLEGLSVHPLWTSVNSTALIEAAKAGLGITVLPGVLVQEELENGSLLALEAEDFTLKNDLFALWHKEKHLSRVFETFLSCIEA